MGRKSDHDRIVRLEERVRSDRRALKLQRKEYKRRLRDLNHENAKNLARNAEFVSLDKFEGMESESRRAREAVQVTLSELKGRESGILSARALLFTIIGLVLAVLALLPYFRGK